MKYLYYTLHLFYVKIIRLHKQYPPIINITAGISILFVFLIFSIVNAYYYNNGHEFPPYHFLIPGVGFLLFWKLLYEYYKPREARLLEGMREKPFWLKVLIVMLSFLFIIIVVKLWMFDGSTELYAFLKRNWE